MAKISAIWRNKHREEKVNRAKKKRTVLKEVVRTGSDDEKYTAQLQLQKMSPNSSHVRVRSRCNSCGRPRATLKKFGLCRVCLREAAMRGDVPGLRKASW